MLVQATDIFLRPPSEPLLTGEGSAMSNFRERLSTLKTGLCKMNMTLETLFFISILKKVSRVKMRADVTTNLCTN